MYSLVHDKYIPFGRGCPQKDEFYGITSFSRQHQHIKKQKNNLMTIKSCQYILDRCKSLFHIIVIYNLVREKWRRKSQHRMTSIRQNIWQSQFSDMPNLIN